MDSELKETQTEAMKDAGILKGQTFTGFNTVSAMEMEDGRTGVVCHTQRHGWLTATYELAVYEAREHLNNVCELRHLLPLRK